MEWQYSWASGCSLLGDGVGERERNGKFQNTLLHQSITVINRNYLKTSHTNNFLPCRGEWGNLSEMNTDANCLQITMLLVPRSVSLP